MGPGPAEVRTLPGMIKDWIDVSHGETPTSRAASETALFFVLTKFDREFEQAAGQSEDSSQRWTTRLESCLTKFFGQAHDWPRNGNRGVLSTISTLRNPNVFSPQILDYDADAGRSLFGRVKKLASTSCETSSRTLRSRSIFMTLEGLDEAFRLNDGEGATWPTVRPVCNRTSSCGRSKPGSVLCAAASTTFCNPTTYLGPGDRRRRIAVYCLAGLYSRSTRSPWKFHPPPGDRAAGPLRGDPRTECAALEWTVQNPIKRRKRRSSAGLKAFMNCRRTLAQAVGIDNSLFRKSGMSCSPNALHP